MHWAPAFAGATRLTAHQGAAARTVVCVLPNFVIPAKAGIQRLRSSVPVEREIKGTGPLLSQGRRASPRIKDQQPRHSSAYFPNFVIPAKAGIQRLRSSVPVERDTKCTGPLLSQGRRGSPRIKEQQPRHSSASSPTSSFPRKRESSAFALPCRSSAKSKALGPCFRRGDGPHRASRTSSPDIRLRTSPTSSFPRKRES